MTCFCTENSLANLTRYSSYFVTILLAVFLCCCCKHKKVSHYVTLAVCILVAIVVADLVVKPLFQSLLNDEDQENFSAPVKYNMNTGYGGKVLEVAKPPGEYWKHDPQNTALLNPNALYTNFPSSCPLAKEYKAGTVSGVGVPVDGKDGPKDMFIFAANKASPDCCPSTYSTSTGCICTTKDQRNFINSRGNNHNMQFKNVGNGENIGE